MVICLQSDANCLHMVQLMPLHLKTPSSLASFKSRLVFTFLVSAYPGWKKSPLNGCSSVVVVISVCQHLDSLFVKKNKHLFNSLFFRTTWVNQY